MYAKTPLALQFVLVSLLVSPPAIAQCDLDWNLGQPLAGVSGTVFASTVHDDGNGTKLYIGGSFGLVANASANGIAAFDGTSWSPVGDGVFGTVHALASFDGGLYAGGLLYFNDASAFILRWDGQSWSNVPGGPNNIVNALAVHDGALFAGGGDFDLFRWDGSNWTTIEGLDGSSIYSLASHDGLLYASGDFRIDGHATDENIAAWNGAGWQSLGSGLDNHADALHSHQGELFVGGHFRRAGSLNLTGVARWNGQTWLPLGNEIDSAGNRQLNEFASFGGDVYAIGAFRMPAELPPSQCVARWNGNEWVGVASYTAPASIGQTAATYDGRLYVGGSIPRFGETRVRNLGIWDGNAWQRISPGATTFARKAAEFAGDLFVSSLVGEFDGVEIFGVGRFDGQTWHDASLGVSETVGPLTVLDDRLLTTWSDVPAGGWRLSEWNGASWQPLPGLFNQSVTVIAQYEGELVVGGLFSAVDGQLRNRLARFDGSAWQPLGLGVGLQGITEVTVSTLADFQGALVVGGRFDTVDGLPAVGLAAWNGAAWSQFGGGVSGASRAVYRLLERDGWLYVGGSFNHVGAVNANNIARWDGQTWHPLGSGTSGRVEVIQPVGQSMYVGGAFSTAGGQAAGSVARWDGQAWHAVDGGLSNSYSGVGVIGSAVHSERLYLVGGFTRANTDISFALASLDLPALTGDFDRDGDTDLQDLATLLSGFGTESGPGDLDADGDTDLEDLAILLADFGVICP